MVTDLADGKQTSEWREDRKDPEQQKEGKGQESELWSWAGLGVGFILAE